MALPVGLVLAEPVQGKCRGCGRSLGAFACGHDIAACLASHDPGRQYASALLANAPRGPSGRSAWQDGAAEPLPPFRRATVARRACRRRGRA